MLIPTLPCSRCGPPTKTCARHVRDNDVTRRWRNVQSTGTARILFISTKTIISGRVRQIVQVPCARDVSYYQWSKPSSPSSTFSPIYSCFLLHYFGLPLHWPTMLSLFAIFRPSLPARLRAPLSPPVFRPSLPGRPGSPLSPPLRIRGARTPAILVHYKYKYVN